MRGFEYASAAGLADVGELLNDDGVRVLAGGTDLLPLMKADVVQPTRLVDVKRVSELASGIVETADGVSIGALTSLSAIEAHAGLAEKYSALVEAVSLAATPQLRNMATLGGNLLQRPRCWYFRSPAFHCWLKGGEECQAREGENQLHAIFDVSPCVAVHPSDAPAALIALDAAVDLRRGDEARTVPLAAFFAVPRDDSRTENVLRPDELVVSVRLPSSAGLRSTYRKAMNRKVWAFALAGVAACVRMESDRVSFARIVLNGVAPVPWRVQAAEQELLGSLLDEAVIDRAADAALADARPLANNGYKVQLTRGLIKQALRALR
ncbi:MAG: xanthine dehydrogenase family protein subunit M [Chloroflexi bacterium]|nr:xanthine dehydrogenase family protein subunit M [Chloroflexota bacterium]